MSVKSTAMLDFLLKNLQKLINLVMQSYLFITSELIFILKQIFCLPKKSLDNYFFRWFTYKSFLADFQCYQVVICGLLINFPYPAVSHVFQGPAFSVSRFFRVQVFQSPGFSGCGSRVQGPGPGSGSRVQGPGSRSRVRVQVLEVVV